MALVSKGYKLTVTLGSSNERTMNAIYNLVAATETAALAARTTILTNLNNVSAGVVKATSLTLRHEEDAFVSPTSLQAQFGERATLITNIEDNPTKTANIGIPMPETGIFLAPSGVLMDTININNLEVVQYHGMFSTGGICTISDGEVADTLIRGVRG